MKRSAAAMMAAILFALCFTVLLNTPHIYAENETQPSASEDLSHDKQEAQETQKPQEIQEYDIKSKTIAVVRGTAADRIATVFEQDSRSDVERYAVQEAVLGALREKTVDCAIMDEQPARELAEKNYDIYVYEIEQSSVDYVFSVGKQNPQLLTKINAALKKLKANGTIDGIVANYICTDDQQGRNPYQIKPDLERDGTVTLGVLVGHKPYAYLENSSAEGKIVGIDVDIMQAVCDELKMNLNVVRTDADNAAGALAYDTIDVAAVASTDANTSKLMRNVADFSDIYTTSTQVFLFYDENAVDPEEEKQQQDEKEKEKEQSTYDFHGKTIGVQTGTTSDELVTPYEKDGSATVERYTKAADAIQALKQKKIDCVVIDEQPAKKFYELNQSDLRILRQALSSEDYALCFRKGNNDLRSKINNALKKLKEDGIIDRITANYIGTDEERGNQPYQKKDVRRSGTLVVATNAEFKPYEYFDHDRIVGIDIDIMQAVCDEIGMELSIENMEFDSILAAVQGGKADVGAAGISVTEDRKKSVDFSDAYTTSRQVIMIYDNSIIKSVDDLVGKTIGVQTGTTGDTLATGYEKDGTATIERYTKAADAIQSLKQNKIDCVILDEQPALAFVNSNSGLRIVEEEFSDEDYAFCVRKGDTELLNKINNALKKLKEDGTLDKIKKNYVGTDDEIGKNPYQKKDVQRSGTLVVATNAEFPPYEYFDHDNIVGIDMDIMQAVCDEIGMELTIENMEFDSILAAVQGGKAQIGAAGITVTEDRKKQVDFTDPYTTSKQVIIIGDRESTGSELPFWERIKHDFVDEDRWQYLVNGLLVTLEITGLAILVGLLLGTLIAIVRTIHEQNGKLIILNFICKLYLTVIRGTPAMLQLLIIYYAVFSSVRVSKVLVAVVAFGINSAAYVAEVIRSGINAVDKGQFEAGCCLGLNYRRTMFGIIMPQAFKNMLPALLNEFIALLKETAICGYIGLMDLTKGGDIIRSQTFDVFLPLIAVALIYLIIVIILTRIVTILERRLKKQ